MRKNRPHRGGFLRKFPLQTGEKFHGQPVFEPSVELEAGAEGCDLDNPILDLN